MTKSAEELRQSAEAGIMETPINAGRLSSVVCSADCRSAEPPTGQKHLVSEEKGQSGDGATGSPSRESAELPLAAAPPAWFRIYVHAPWPGTPNKRPELVCTNHPQDSHDHVWHEGAAPDLRWCECGRSEFLCAGHGSWRESMGSRTWEEHRRLRQLTTPFGGKE